MRTRRLLTLGAAALALVCSVGPVAGAATIDPADPIGGARRAERAHAFDGTLRVAWRADGGWRTRTFTVHSDAGSLAVEGDATTTARGDVRAIVDGASAHVLWDRPAAPGPSITGKYAVEVSATARDTVAGRAAFRVTVRDRRGRTREVLALDASTGLLLRRVTLDEAGRRMRVVAFERVDVAATPTAGEPTQVPDRTAGRAPAPVRTVVAPYVLVRRLPGGFRLVGVYRAAGGRELFFSDGLYGVSVFQWRGALDRSALPEGGRTGGSAAHGARTYDSPLGPVSVWSDDDLTFSVVSETTPTETARIVAELPGSAAPGSIDGVGGLLVAPFTLP